MAIDELEDLESMRRRIREEARIRREYELQRRRKKAASRRRRRLREEGGGGGYDDGDDASSSSSSSSADLLASSPSPSPSPPPPRLDDVVELGTSSMNIKSRGISTIAMQGRTTSSTNSGIERMPSSSTSSAVKAPVAARTTSHTEQNNSGFDNSDSSDSDIDMDEVAKRIVERKQMAGRGTSNNCISSKSTDGKACTVTSSSINGDNSAGINLRIPWSDESSEDETGRLLTPPATGKGNTSDSHKATPSMHSDSKLSSHSQEQEGDTRVQSFGGTVEISTSNANANNERAVDVSRPSLKANALHHSSTFEQHTILNPQQMEERNTSDQELHSASNCADNVPSADALEEATMTTNSQSTGAVEAHLKSAPAKSVDTSDPIIGKDVRHKQSNVIWTTQKQCLLIRSVVTSHPTPRNKVAGFDLDQTLVNWRCAGWPSKSEHYEMWNSTVIENLRTLYDNEGYALVIFSNQGGIKNALGGKKAGTVKGIIDWIAEIVHRPLFAIVSTKINSGYHKPSPSMWTVFEEICNYGKEASPEKSFFVGDADGSGDAITNPQQQQHQQTGTDKLFAEQVGEMRNATMKFHTPSAFFGPSNVDRRRSSMTVVDSPPPLPPEAIRARAALLGGYMKGPICLVLVGVQGSGKSTFCQSLMQGAGCDRWAHFSQDTINNGTPGTRQAVEIAAEDAIRSGNNVVIDRMHLDEEQRRHFINLGRQCQVPVHCLVITATKEEVEDRVKHRVNHPGKVEGDYGARIAVASLSRLTPPKYDEGFELISYFWQKDDHLLHSYRRVGSLSVLPLVKTIRLCSAENFSLPMITLGTMNVRKLESESLVTRALQMGVTSVDTAPTYGNETEVGFAIKLVSDAVVTIKIPKRATTAGQARKEVMQSLSRLQRSRVDIILLHWPCDFIEAGTLSAVWQELETMKKDDLCSVIGVCNFNTMALKLLLSHCTIKPALNQVERHPMLPQYDLLDFCNSQGIAVQAHTPLGNGSDLLLGHDSIVHIASEIGMSPAQGQSKIFLFVKSLFYLLCMHPHMN
jgi:DNA 3'-phosphatase